MKIWIDDVIMNNKHPSNQKQWWWIDYLAFVTRICSIELHVIIFPFSKRNWDVFWIKKCFVFFFESEKSANESRYFCWNEPINQPINCHLYKYHAYCHRALSRKHGTEWRKSEADQALFNRNTVWYIQLYKRVNSLDYCYFTPWERFHSQHSVMMWSLCLYDLINYHLSDKQDRRQTNSQNTLFIFFVHLRWFFILCCHTVFH